MSNPGIARACGASKPPGWRVERVQGTAAEVLARPLPEGPVARVVSLTRPAVVLGSTQREDAVDVDRAASQGVDVARRRGGGGAVLVEPGDLLWVDVFVPADHPRWAADVSIAFHWLGAAWAGALAGLGVEATWHDGTLCTTTWSRLVCFSGIGPGEVSVDGRKAVGLSQRRSRAGSLFLCAALLRWDAAALVQLLSLSDAERERAAADLGPVARGLDVEEAALERAFLDALER
jgi:lipoate-protein ligase A